MKNEEIGIKNDMGERAYGDSPFFVSFFIFWRLSATAALTIRTRRSIHRAGAGETGACLGTTDYPRGQAASASPARRTAGARSARQALQPHGRPPNRRQSPNQ